MELGIVFLSRTLIFLKDVPGLTESKWAGSMRVVIQHCGLELREISHQNFKHQNFKDL